MPNYPVKARNIDGRRPPRYERLRDLSAFVLGYEPYHALAELHYTEDELAPYSQRWLLDLPVHLSPFLDPYTVERLGMTVKEVLADFDDYPSDPPPAERGGDAELSEEMELPSTGLSETEGREESAPEVDFDVLPEEKFEAIPEDVDNEFARPFSHRIHKAFVQARWGGEHSAHALIRLAQSASEMLPDSQRQWFRFGQSVGQSYLRVASSEEQACKEDLKREIQQAATGTDWPSENVPDIGYGAFADSEDATPSYTRWANSRIERLVSDVERFLEDDEPVL